MSTTASLRERFVQPNRFDPASKCPPRRGRWGEKVDIGPRDIDVLSEALYAETWALPFLCRVEGNWPQVPNMPNPQIFSPPSVSRLNRIPADVHSDLVFSHRS